MNPRITALFQLIDDALEANDAAMAALVAARVDNGTTESRAVHAMTAYPPGGVLALGIRRDRSHRLAGRPRRTRSRQFVI